MINSDSRFSVRFIVFSILSIACMILIFIFSNENATESSGTSGVFVDVIVNNFIKDFDNLPPEKHQSIIDSIQFAVRKTAHFSIYLLLGFLVSCAFGKRKILSRISILTIAICFFYACSDELHQYFIPGRACRFTDVLIDSSGSIVGMLLSLLCLKIAYSIIDKNNYNKKEK